MAEKVKHMKQVRLYGVNRRKAEIRAKKERLSITVIVNKVLEENL